MIISQLQQAIDSLELAMPLGFIFVLDTTDRSFIYKSFGRHDCSDEVIQIDQNYGIDKLMNDLEFYIHSEEQNRLILKKIESNSFLGICVRHNEYDEDLLGKARKILL